MMSSDDDEITQLKKRQCEIFQTLQKLQNQDNNTIVWYGDKFVPDNYEYYPAENSDSDSDIFSDSSSDDEEEEEEEEDNNNINNTNNEEDISVTKNKDDINIYNSEQKEDSESESDEQEEEEEFTENILLDKHDSYHPHESNLIALSKTYDIDGRIFCTSDAVVYDGFCRDGSGRVAIKVHNNPPWSFNSEMHPKEIRILSRAQGIPGIVPIVCWHKLPRNDTYALVTKYTEHEEDPDKFLMSFPTKAKQYLYDLAVALRGLHERGIVYRDIKPSNVLWNDEKKTTTLIDFDVSTFERKLGHVKHTGTEGYRAPEMLKYNRLVKNWFKNGQKGPRPMGYDNKVDVFAFGMLASGIAFNFTENDASEDPSSEYSARAIVAKIKKMMKPPGKNNKKKKRRKKTLPDREALILECLRPIPEDRPTMSQVIEHLYFKSITCSVEV